MTNLRFGFDINESIQISLDLLNIFDSDDHDIEYFYESQLLGEQQPVADNHYHVFEPRPLGLSAVSAIDFDFNNELGSEADMTNFKALT